MDRIIVECSASGPVLACSEGLSFWGGVIAETGIIADVHHPQFGSALSGHIVMMPTSRGSCSGSGVLLELAMNGHAPAALIFHEEENILTLGAFIAAEMFEKPIAVIQLCKENYNQILNASYASIQKGQIIADDLEIALSPLDLSQISLSAEQEAMLCGQHGDAIKLAMNAIITMAAIQGATQLTPITRSHIDGCIYASPANLEFAEAMLAMGAKVKIPTTMNAISVDHKNWRFQGVASEFGEPASQLANAYVAMGAQATFTCAPYLAEDRPSQSEAIGWSESNAVIYANSVLGARTVKHPDFFDLFVAMTGFAPLSGVYLQKNRKAQLCIKVDLPENSDEAIWPLIGWVTGKLAPDKIPVIEGLEHAELGTDDLKALCAAFGTTSAVPLLHIKGITPEAQTTIKTKTDNHENLPTLSLTQQDLVAAWQQLNEGPAEIDLVALGSPHFSITETRHLTQLMTDRSCSETISMIVTLSRETFAKANNEGLIDLLKTNGVQIVQDLCWCSISEPVFPPNAKTLLTNSAKYAHYAPGLCGRSVRFAGLKDCVLAAQTGHLSKSLPDWLTQNLEVPA